MTINGQRIKFSRNPDVYVPLHSDRSELPVFEMFIMTDFFRPRGEIRVTSVRGVALYIGVLLFTSPEKLSMPAISERHLPLPRHQNSYTRRNVGRNLNHDLVCTGQQNAVSQSDWLGGTGLTTLLSCILQRPCVLHGQLFITKLAMRLLLTFFHSVRLHHFIKRTGHNETRKWLLDDF